MIKIFSRFVSMLLTATFTISAAVMPFEASGIELNSDSSDKLKISLADVSIDPANVGDKIEIPVNISGIPSVESGDNTGKTLMQLQFSYKYSDNLAFVGAKKGENGQVTPEAENDSENTEVAFYYYADSETGIENGIAFNMVFKIKDGGKAGTYDITYDKDADVSFAFSDGTTVTSADYRDCKITVASASETSTTKVTETNANPYADSKLYVDDIVTTASEVYSDSSNDSPVIDVPVIVENNPGITGGAVCISYDKDLFLVDYKFDTAGGFETLKIPSTVDGEQSISFFGTSSYTGKKILTLKFRMPSKESLQLDRKYAVTILTGSLYDSTPKTYFYGIGMQRGCPSVDNTMGGITLVSDPKTTASSDPDVTVTTTENKKIPEISVGSYDINDLKHETYVHTDKGYEETRERLYIPVSIKNNPGFKALDFRLQFIAYKDSVPAYGTAVVEDEDIELAESSLNEELVGAFAFGMNQLNCSFIPAASGTYDNDGTLCTIPVELLPGWENYKKISVVIVVKSMTDKNNNERNVVSSNGEINLAAATTTSLTTEVTTTTSVTQKTEETTEDTDLPDTYNGVEIKSAEYEYGDGTIEVPVILHNISGYSIVEGTVTYSSYLSLDSDDVRLNKSSNPDYEYDNVISGRRKMEFEVDSYSASKFKGILYKLKFNVSHEIADLNEKFPLPLTVEYTFTDANGNKITDKYKVALTILPGTVATTTETTQTQPDITTETTVSNEAGKGTSTSKIKTTTVTTATTVTTTTKEEVPLDAKNVIRIRKKLATPAMLKSEVTVDFVYDNWVNPVASAGFTVHWDDDLELTNFVPGSNAAKFFSYPEERPDLPSTMSYYRAKNVSNKMSFYYSTADPTGNLDTLRECEYSPNNSTNDARLATFRFKLKDGVEADKDYYPIWIEFSSTEGTEASWTGPNWAKFKYYVEDGYIKNSNPNPRAVTTTETPQVVTNDSGEVIATKPVVTTKTIVKPVEKKDNLILGDANLDGKITAEDATMVLIVYASTIIGFDEPLCKKIKYNADCNYDGSYTSEDATLILVYYANSNVGFDSSLYLPGYIGKWEKGMEYFVWDYVKLSDEDHWPLIL